MKLYNICTWIMLNGYPEDTFLDFPSLENNHIKFIILTAINNDHLKITHSYQKYRKK